MACESGHFDVVKYLLDNGAALDMKSHHGQTPLHKASARGHLDIVKYLLDKGVTLNAESQQGRTPLHLASENGCLDVVKYLLEKGATIDSRDNNGWNSLHCAFNSRNEKVVKCSRSPKSMPGRIASSKAYRSAASGMKNAIVTTMPTGIMTELITL
ncbi:hypothetical protein AC1031_011214 [Aphanomyces cochlioides]|nr:hypothetical protein AC1031_011214 [Aphanomyces cochlioides]